METSAIESARATRFFVISEDTIRCHKKLASLAGGSLGAARMMLDARCLAWLKGRRRVCLGFSKVHISAHVVGCTVMVLRQKTTRVLVKLCTVTCVCDPSSLTPSPKKCSLPEECSGCPRVYPNSYGSIDRDSSLMAMTTYH